MGWLSGITHDIGKAWHAIEKPVSDVVFPLVGATEKLGSALTGGGGSTLSNYTAGALGELGAGAGLAGLAGAAGAGSIGATTGAPWDIAMPGAAGSAVTATGGGALDASSLAKLALQGYGALQSYQQAHSLIGMAHQADPFAAYRSGYAQQLAQLQADPSSLTQLPGYQFTLNQGEQALRRKAAAGGFTGSSNLDYALAKYAEGLASQTYNQQVNQLAGLAGANISPTVGLSTTENAFNLQNQALNNLAIGFGGY